MRDQRLVDARLQRRAVLDQVQAEARPLALSPDRRVWQPDLSNQIAPGKLREHARVDAVPLARERRQPFDPLRIRDPHIPTAELELVMHKPRPRHRLDRGQHRRTVSARALSKIAQAVPLGDKYTSSSLDSALSKRRPLQTLATEIQTDLQHAKGLLRDAPTRQHGVCRRRRPTFMALKRYLARNLYRLLENPPLTTRQT